MKSALAALKFLTLAGRLGAFSAKSQQLGHGALYFPFLGLAFGVVLAILNRALEPYLASEILALFLVLTLIIITGAMHLEGTQKTFDVWSEGRNAAGVDGEAARIYGLLVVLLIVLFKARSVEVIGEARNLGLLLAPVLARWSLVVFLYGSAAAGDESTHLIAEQVKGWQLLLTTMATLALAIFLVGRTGLWIALCLSLLALLGRSYLGRRHGGLTRNHLGAVVELSETLTFIFFASF